MIIQRHHAEIYIQSTHVTVAFVQNKQNDFIELCGYLAYLVRRSYRSLEDRGSKAHRRIRLFPFPEQGS